MKFQDGEEYEHPDHSLNIYVLAVEEETDDSVFLAVMHVNPLTKETVGYGELEILNDDADDWQLVD